MGENPCVTTLFKFLNSPCLIQLPILMFNWVVEAVMAGSGVWQDCQSLPTRTLHQRIEPHNGQKNDYALHSFSPLCIISMVYSFLMIVSSSMRIGRVVHPHVGIIVRSLSSRIGFSWFWAHTMSWEPCSFIHNLLWRAIHIFSYMTSSQTGMVM